MIFFSLGRISRRLQRTAIIFMGLTASLANPASSETGVKMTTSYLEGEVVAVDDDLVLHLKITRKVNFDYSPADKIKIFRLDTSPAALRWLTLGRAVICGRMYSEERYLVVRCVIKNIASDSKVLQESWTRLDQLVEKLGLGISKCSQEDIDGIKKIYSKDSLKFYC